MLSSSVQNCKTIEELECMLCTKDIPVSDEYWMDILYNSKSLISPGYQDAQQVRYGYISVCHEISSYMCMICLHHLHQHDISDTRPNFYTVSTQLNYILHDWFKKVQQHKFELLSGFNTIPQVCRRFGNMHIIYYHICSRPIINSQSMKCGIAWVSHQTTL